MQLPRLYAIIDSDLLPQEGKVNNFYSELLRAGVTLLQYRNKRGSPREILSDARELKRLQLENVQYKNVTLIMNDRADLAIEAGFDGVHLGQEDVSVAGTRLLCKYPATVGISTHNVEQVMKADGWNVEYIAVGPIFETASKSDPDPVVGIEGLRAARKLTGKPLVAIGGITRRNCQSVIDAGADSVAVISDLLGEPTKSAGEFLRMLS